LPTRVKTNKKPPNGRKSAAEGDWGLRFPPPPPPQTGVVGGGVSIFSWDLLGGCVSSPVFCCIFLFSFFFFLHPPFFLVFFLNGCRVGGETPFWVVWGGGGTPFFFPPQTPNQPPRRGFFFAPPPPIPGRARTRFFTGCLSGGSLLLRHNLFFSTADRAPGFRDARGRGVFPPLFAYTPGSQGFFFFGLGYFHCGDPPQNNPPKGLGFGVLHPWVFFLGRFGLVSPGWFCGTQIFPFPQNFCWNFSLGAPQVCSPGGFPPCCFTIRGLWGSVLFLVFHKGFLGLFGPRTRVFFRSGKPPHYNPVVDRFGPPDPGPPNGEKNRAPGVCLGPFWRFWGAAYRDWFSPRVKPNQKTKQLVVFFFFY